MATMRSAAVLSALAAAAGLRMTSTPDEGRKVTVRVYGEAGCPFTRAYLAGPVRAALSDPGTSDLMDFDYHPFGNAYFVTEECKAAAGPEESGGAGCGGGGSYSGDVRDCFDRACGAGAENRSSACFEGPLVCQHGLKECTFDRYLACAKDLAATASPGPKPYMPFVLCMVDAYESTAYGESFLALLGSCAKGSGLDLEGLRSCYAGARGKAAVVAEATATPPHPGVPMVTVGGVELPESYEVAGLRVAVLHASGGRLPLAASKETEETVPSLRSTGPAPAPCGEVDSVGWQAPA